jgi:glycyl-tRNA synthetase beta chain
MPIHSAPLLVELGTEELPPMALPLLGDAFAEQLAVALEEAGLLATGAPRRWYATPRRLAVHLGGVARRAADQIHQRRGPSIKAAFDAAGQPTPAAKGFARSCGVDVPTLAKETIDGGEYLVWRSTLPGLAAIDLIPDCIKKAAAGLPVPKRMRWGRGTAQFVRPVHWTVVIHGKRSIKCEVFGIRSSNRTWGHRFLSNTSFPITDADHYVETLKKQSVIVSFDERRNLIRQQATRLARRVNGRVVLSPELLDLVTALVESPHALLGEFDTAYLQMPTEVLIASMRDHQKYFHVTDEAGHLLPHFIAVSNIPLTRSGRVREGNERVLKARLDDARFFLEADRQHTLEQRLADLKGVLFHRELGSLFDKSLRLETLASAIAGALHVSPKGPARAARLAKTDLVSSMVGEFPELQGIMGRYYAAQEGEVSDVTTAIEEHYLPRYAGDRLPSTRTGRIVALADKIDSIIGIFSTDEAPTGEKDPYALRRAALGIIRLLVEKRMDLDLNTLFRLGAETYIAQNRPVTTQACDKSIAFVTERYRAFYEAGGYRADELAAVAATGTAHALDFNRRLKVVSRFRHHPAAASLAAANKRISNILRQAGEQRSARIDSSLLELDAEHALANHLLQTASVVSPLLQQGDYAQALTHLAKLKTPTDRFFDEVRVMVEDPALRQNRLALLKHLADLFLAIANFSHLQLSE